MRYAKPLMAALVLLLTLCACSTTPQVPQTRLGECPRPPGTLLQRVDLRLRVLQVLSTVPGYRANETLVRQQLANNYGHALSQDALRTELAWLNEQGLLSYTDSGAIVFATISTRGKDCASGLVQLPGVARPSPEEMLLVAGVGLLRQP